MCLEKLNFRTNWAYLVSRNLEIDCNLFSKLILEVIERSKANIYLIVKVWNYYSSIITGNSLFCYCKLIKIYTYYPC